MSKLKDIDTPEKFNALWKQLRAEKRLLTTNERIEVLEHDVLLLQVGQVRTTHVLEELVKKLEGKP